MEWQDGVGGVGFDLADGLNRMFDAFIQLDVEDTMYVYAWRLEQEAALREAKGMGMTDEQVEAFVDGCKSRGKKPGSG